MELTSVLRCVACDRAILVRVMTDPNEPQCSGSFLILKMFPETLPTSTSLLNDAQRDFSGTPLPPPSLKTNL